MAIRALPPKAKITAEVWSGRSRPNDVQGRPKFSSGKASWKAMKVPAAKPITAQKAVAMTPARITPSW